MRVADNTTYCTFGQLIALVDPQLRAICIALRDVISDRHRDRFETASRCDRRIRGNGTRQDDCSAGDLRLRPLAVECQVVGRVSAVQQTAPGGHGMTELRIHTNVDSTPVVTLQFS